MNSRIKVDRLSVLPDNVKDIILTRLTIKEAVRTSILSQSWRYQWHCLSKININRRDLSGVSQVERVKIIDHILLCHCGSFDKFKLDIDIDTPIDIDRWILYLSRNGIKNLIISRLVGHSNLPIHLFPCSGLTHLELTGCMLKPLPAAFKAFSNLAELLFDHVIIDNEVLEKLINSCPLLNRLSLLSVNSDFPLRINAPKLVMLHMSDSFAFPLLKNTPLLESVLLGPFSIPLGRYCMIFEFLRSMPLLRRLELRHSALRDLAVGDRRDTPANNHPLVCPVKHLILWMNFNDLREMQAAFCLFKSSPFIRILDLKFPWLKRTKSRISADAFWKGQEGLNVRLDNLQEVKVTSFSGIEYELKFIEFLLAKAPALETMEIKFRDERMNAEDLFSVITKLTWFPRASPKAKLILPSNMSQIMLSN